MLADRTQAPAGLGFILENRSVLSRVLPEAMQALRPSSLSDALRIRRDALRCLARSEENPAIALLTPGPRNEVYFEHAYLARLLGLHARRGRRPDGAGSPRVVKDAGGPASGGRDYAPA